MALINLWLVSAQTRSEGTLHGMDETDIALEAQWAGDPHELVKTLLDIGWLEKNGSGIFYLHDWKKHQPHIAHAKERSENAKRAAQIRWKKQPVNAPCMQSACAKHANSNIPSPNPKKPFVRTSIEFRLSQLLLDLIREQKPDFKKPDLQKWAVHIEYMIRLDKRKPHIIAKVIKWCRADDFWQINILSTEKLRKQFDQLQMKMEMDNAKRGRGNSRGKRAVIGKTQSPAPYSDGQPYPIDHDIYPDDSGD